MRSLEAFGRRSRVVINPNANGSKWRPSVSERIDGEPVKVIAVGGWGSPGSRDLGDVRHALEHTLPDGSSVDLYTFTTGINVGILPKGIPSELRGQDVRKLGYQMEAVTEDVEPLILFGHSLGGIIANLAWLKHPHAARGLVAAGSPFGMPGFGVSEKPDTGEIYTVWGSRDLVVPGFLSSHRQEIGRQRVRGGHFALTYSREGLSAITEGMKHVAFANEANNTLPK